MVRNWLKSVFVRESWLTRSAVRVMAGPGPITMVLLVRDEIDIIEANLRFHLERGIEHFVVTDNGSKDGTRDILADFAQRVPNFIIIDEPRKAYLQEEFVTRMICVAKERFRPQWILPADADEFWYAADGSYDTELKERSANILYCRWHNFIPRADCPWPHFTDIGEFLGYNGRMCKVLCLARGLAGMYVGNHECRAVPHVARPSENIRVYHYPVRSYQQFERKIVQGGQAVLAAQNLPPTTAAHWREAYRAWEEGRLAEVYRQLVFNLATGRDETMVAVLPALCRAQNS